MLVIYGILEIFDSLVERIIFIKKLRSPKGSPPAGGSLRGKHMNKLIKEILTNKKARNFSALMAFVVSVMSAGAPWQGGA